MKGRIILKILFKLFYTFAKIGGLTFGGGYAMLPMLQKEVVEKNKWASEEELMDYFAIGQCTPGIIAVNTATFIGYKVHGVIGGVFATLGMVFPSIVIITVIAAFIRNFTHIEAVKHAFNGIQVCVCALILDSIIKLGKKSLTDKWCIGIYAIAVILTVALDISAVFIVIGAGVLGVLINFLINKSGRKEGE